MVGDLVGGQDTDPFLRGAQGLADDEGAVHFTEQQREFGGTGAGRGEHGDLGVGAADVDGAAQGAFVGDHDAGVVPGHSGPREGLGDRRHAGHDLDLQAVFRCAQRPYDTEEARVAVGEDHGGAPVPGDTAGGQVDTAEDDPLGVRRDERQGEVVAGAGHQGGGHQGRPRGLGRW